MHAGRGKQVFAAHDIRYALLRVIDNDADVIARADVATRKNDVAPGLRFGGKRALDIAEFEFGPGPPSDYTDSPFHVEPPRRAFAGREPRLAFGRIEVPARAGIKWRAVGIAGPIRAPGNRAQDIPARTKAGIDQAAIAHVIERSRILGQMLALPAHRLFQFEAYPGEVLINRTLVFRAAARDIDVFDAQEQASAALARHLCV